MDLVSAAGVHGRILLGGRARGPLLRLRRPISFWGGIDPIAGTVVDPRHPDVGVSIRGTVLAIPAAIGSSSSSAIMLELMREGTAPAAILIGRADAILALGAVVGRELGYAAPPFIEVPIEALSPFGDGEVVEVKEDGSIDRPGPGR